MLHIYLSSEGCTNGPSEAATPDGSLASPPAKSNKTPQQQQQQQQQQ